MKQLALLAMVISLGFTIGIESAEAAKRFGGGKSAGMQRQIAPQQKASTTTQTPAPAQSAATAAAKPQAAAGGQKRSWMGPVAGLAAGLGLAALASHFGFGEELASMMMIGLLVMAVMVAIGLVMRRRTGTPQPAMAGGMQHAAYDQSPVSGLGRRIDLATAAFPTSSASPADFDSDAFLRGAKVLFVRLQAANDSANLADIREFTTPEMFAEVRMEIAERGELPQQTDVLNVQAELIERVAEEGRQVASVRFQAMLREGSDAAAVTVEEIWHLVLPQGRRAWCLAGIEQIR